MTKPGERESRVLKMESGSTPKWLRDRPYEISVMALCLFAFLAQSWNLGLATFPYSDEGVSAQAGRLLFSGFLPYRDFVYVHLPVSPLLIGGGLELFGDMYWLRLIYLASNCAGGFLLFVFLRSLADRGDRHASVAALLTVILYFTYHRMVATDFRFIAIRQSSNLLFLVFLLGHMQGWKIATRASAVVGSFLFIPFGINVALYSVYRSALRGWTDYRSHVALLGGIGLVALAFMLLVPGAFEHTVELQRDRPSMDYMLRLNWTIDRSWKDLVFYAAGLSGLILGCARSERHIRWLCLTFFIILLLTVFLPRGFYPHYLVAAAIPFCLGQFLLFRSLLSRRILLPVIASIVLGHLYLSVPSLFREFTENRYPDYYELIEKLSRSPGPVLTFEPIYAVDSRQTIVPHRHQADMRILRVFGESLEERDLNELVSRSCTLLIEPFFARGFFPEATLQDWTQRYRTTYSNRWGTILETDHSFCWNQQPRGDSDTSPRS